MDLPAAKLKLTGRALALASVAILAAAACAPQPAAPTAAPPKPAPTAAPAQPAPTTAPAKAEAPAAKPAPTTAPAAKPTEKPAAKAAEFDEKAVADFYKGKTVRITVGVAPGGASDTNARMLQQVLSRYIPGNPNVVVENKLGGGHMMAANTAYGTEPKDGTVVTALDVQLVIQQLTGAPGIQFDAAKFNWISSTMETSAACAVRTDVGINSVQEVMEGGKELTMSSFGKGSVSYDPAAIFNTALGTKFKIVTGYEGGAAQRLAVKNKEVQGFCTSFDTLASVARDMFEGDNPANKVLIVSGSEVLNHPFLKGVPAAEKLAKTDEARTLLRAIHTPIEMTLPFAMAPEVPRDRVLAIRRAYEKAYTDPDYRAAAEKAKQAVSPRTGEQVTQAVLDMLKMPPAVVAKLKDALK